MQAERWAEARKAAEALAALAPPGAPGPAQMLERIDAELARSAGSAAPESADQ
jgi:hypothetical protein